MGNIITRWIDSLSVKDTRILILGLDAAGNYLNSLNKDSYLSLFKKGKTTIVYKLKLGDVVTTIPTIGFNVETIEYKKLRMTMWYVIFSYLSFDYFYYLNIFINLFEYFCWFYIEYKLN